MEGLVRNAGDFARFLETMSFSRASVLNITNIAREAQINRKTVENYLHILEDLLLGFRIEVFVKRRGATIPTARITFTTGKREAASRWIWWCMANLDCTPSR